MTDHIDDTDDMSDDPLTSQLRTGLAGDAGDMDAAYLAVTRRGRTLQTRRRTTLGVLGLIVVMLAGFGILNRAPKTEQVQVGGGTTTPATTVHNNTNGNLAKSDIGGTWCAVVHGQTVGGCGKSVLRAGSYLTFETNGTWSGSDGCNGSSGTYTLGPNGAFHMVDHVSTLIACRSVPAPIPYWATHAMISNGELVLAAPGRASHVAVYQPTGTGTPQQVALALARQIVSEATLPPGSTKSNIAFPSSLSEPASTPGFRNLEGVSQLWVTNESPSTALHWLESHLPAGFTLAGTSSGSGPGAQGVVLGTGGSLNVLPENISYAALQFQATAASPDCPVHANCFSGTYIRVDAITGWVAPRPANEYVPATDKVVSVTVACFSCDLLVAPKPHITSNPKLVQPIINAFNALAVEPPGAVYNCPMIGANSVTYRVAFSATTTTTPDIVVTIGLCGPDQVTVHGRVAPSLSAYANDGGAFGDAVAHVLGLATPHFG